ncbi:nucleoside hydrolase 3-like [Amaranthus tricolor]|uniref:nucleoside hydrolase 3-like n=1 Tax=Amaranthus tricolor TaxID=29722 RepID=UPI00258C1FF9|nr:nucleoside hydrolase 3-like [Amaranthus tricolor]
MSQFRHSRNVWTWMTMKMISIVLLILTLDRVKGTQIQTQTQTQNRNENPNQNQKTGMERQHRLLVDTDVDTDDFFALLYLLKLNRSQFDIKGVTINANAWTNSGHAVNQMYDMLYMMGRDDIPVGVGGDGGISYDGTIFPNVGGYHPIIEQGMTTTGYCRYRQAIPLGQGGRLDIDTNYGVRKAFLPQGRRRYAPLHQPTAQEVMINVISEGPTTVFLIGAHTNLALFLMHNPQLKKNLEHIYMMGGGVRSKNPTGCCPKNSSTSCKPEQCGDHGNVFTDYTSNPYAEFNMFGDPFAAYQVIHSGVPITLVPLDATNTIPITENFFKAFEKNQKTYEAQYCFQSLKLARDTWFNGQFYSSYFMWDSFMAGVAVSIMRNDQPHGSGENEFAEMEFMNITVRTSNKPYGISDGSNPFFDGRKTPKFHLDKHGVHSGHVQRSLRDPFCVDKNGKGRCKDGYTEETSGPEGVKVLVATRAKPNKDPTSPLDREFFINFLDVLNHPHQSGKFNFTTQFPHYKEVLYKPHFGARKLGRTVIFDMDMSAGDFLALFYLLKVPIEILHLKAIFITPTGWANAATIDVVYDLLHMMGRDDIQVGLGDVFARNQSDPSFSAVGDCKYVKSIPQGSGGFLDSDTLYGLARDLPRSSRRYTAENSVKFGAPRDTEHLELRQPLVLEIWNNITKTSNPNMKVTILTNGPLTTLSKILSSDKRAMSKIQDVFVLGGHINFGALSQKGNLFTVPSNKYGEFNMYLDPLSAKTVIESKLPITLITLKAQKKVSSFPSLLETLSRANKTPESRFTQQLISKLLSLQKQHGRYQHVDMFLGEILGAVILGDHNSSLKASFEVKPIKVIITGKEETDGQMVVDTKDGTPIRILKSFDEMAYYDLLANHIGDKKQSAVVGSFSEQKRIWSRTTST